jgi:hypothetical protein
MSAPNASFKEIEGYFKKMPFQEGAENNFYTFLHIISQILLGIKNGDLDASKITTPDGEVAFTPEEAVKANGLIKTIEPIVNGVFGSSGQRGGGMDVDPEQLASQLLALAGSAVDPEQISVDNLYFKMTDYFDKLDDQNRSIARQIGPVAFTSELKVDPFVPNPLQVIGIPPPKFQIPARSILPITNAILELFRIMVTLSPIQFPFIRNLLTITIAIFDVLRGEWKYGLFSLLGLLGNKPLLFGVFLKIVRDAWLLIEPGLAKQLRTNVFKASKSMFVGFWLWSFATFAPDFIRGPLESGVTPFRELVDTLNDQVTSFQEQANVAAEPLGIKVTFPTVPTDIVPSFADIQNLQTIVQQPEIYCSAPVKALLEPIKLLPPLRFVLEMLNIPMVPELQAEACKGIDPDNLSGELAKRLRPQIDILPGGVAEKAMQAAALAQAAASAAENPLGALTTLVPGGDKFTSALADPTAAVPGADKLTSVLGNPTVALTDAIDATKSQVTPAVQAVRAPIEAATQVPITAQKAPIEAATQVPITAQKAPIEAATQVPITAQKAPIAAVTKSPENEDPKPTTKGGRQKTLRRASYARRTRRHRRS